MPKVGRPRVTPEKRRLREVEEQCADAMWQLNLDTLTMVQTGVPQEEIDAYVKIAMKPIMEWKSEIAMLKRQLGIRDV